MTGCFVRGLWGDELVDGYAGLLNDVSARGRDAIKPVPCMWLAWGLRNAEAIRAAGFTPIVMSDEPIPARGFLGTPDYLTGYGVRPFGYNIYRLKLEAIAHVLGFPDVDGVVWLDADVEQIAPLPPDFWNRLHDGQPLQAPLVQYHRVQAPWRKQCPRTSIYCATAYFRGLDVVEQSLAYSTEHPLAFEQEAMNWAIDHLAGGVFPGHQGYLEQGFEFPFTKQKGGMIHKPVEVVFAIHSKGWSEYKRDKEHGAERWREHVEAVLEARNKTRAESL